MSKQNKPNKPVNQQKARNTTADKKIKSSANGNIKWIVAIAIGIITGIAFLPALKNSFLNWDDTGYIFNNVSFQKSLGEGISWFFSHFYESNYHPLTMILFDIEYHIVQRSPELFHAVNIILHIINVLMVFWFIYLLSGKKIEVAAFVALFFGIHPMHVESVAWISELKDVLYTFFFIGGLISYYKYSTQKGDKNFRLIVLTFILFILSCLSKPAGITFTLMLPIIDYYINRKFERTVLLEKIPFVIASIILGIVTIKAQEAKSIASFTSISILDKILFVFYGMMTYMGKLFAPINLSAFYPYPNLSSGGGLPVIYYIMPVIALILFFLIYRSIKYTRLIVFGFLFFALNLVLVLQFISVGSAIISERYTYVPYIGLFFIIAMGFSWVYNNKDAKIAMYKPVVITIAVLLGGASFYLTNARIPVWNNADTFWTDYIAKFPDDNRGFENRGAYLMNKSTLDNNPGPPDYERALNDFNAAIAIKAWDPKVFGGRAYILSVKGQYQPAIADYTKAISLDSNDYELYINRAITYCALQKFDSAFKDFDVAVKMHGGDPRIYQNRGYAYLNIGKFIESIDDFTNLIKSEKTVQPIVYFYRSFCYVKVGNLDAALLDNNKAIEMDANYKEAYFNRSQIYLFMKRYQNALDDAMKAQSLGYQVAPDYINEIKKQL